MSILSFFNSFKVKMLFQVSSQAKKLFKVSLDLGHEGRGKNKKKYQSVLFVTEIGRKENMMKKNGRELYILKLHFCRQIRDLIGRHSSDEGAHIMYPFSYIVLFVEEKEIEEILKEGRYV